MVRHKTKGAMWQDKTFAVETLYSTFPPVNSIQPVCNIVGQEQEAIMRSFAEIRRKNELLAVDLAVLRQNQLLQQGNDQEDFPWSDNALDKDFQVKTVSLALDRASLKRVNQSLEDVFASMYVF